MVNTKRVNKTIYVAMAIVFGDFGVHQFYAGKIKKGILYLLFCWTLIPEIFALFDAIKGCGKLADTDGMIEV